MKTAKEISEIVVTLLIAGAIPKKPALKIIRLCVPKNKRRPK